MMNSWTFYPAFIGAFISVTAWTYFAFKEHARQNPRNLSQIAYEKEQALLYYRIVLWICGPLFAITFFGFMVERISHPLVVGIVCSFISIPEILLGFFPARKDKLVIHDYVAGVMGLAMVTAGYLFAFYLKNSYSHIELVLAAAMSILGLLFIITKRRHLHYELPLIYISHFSILVAAIALNT